MTVMAPKNLWELRAMLEFAVDHQGPVAIRYPRGQAYRGLKEFMKPVVYGQGEMLYEEKDIALLAVGSMVSTAEHIREKLKERGSSCSLANGRFVKPFDGGLVDCLARKHSRLVTLEVEHGNVSVLRSALGIDSDSIIRRMESEGFLEE